MKKLNMHNFGNYQANVWVAEPHGHFEQRKVRVEMDIWRLADMLGGKAWKNKSGKAKFAHGLIVVSKGE